MLNKLTDIIRIIILKIANDKSGRLSAIENLPDYNPPLQPVN